MEQCLWDSEQPSQLFFVWLTFPGAIVALRQHGHLGRDSLVAALTRAGKTACFALRHAIMIYVT